MSTEEKILPANIVEFIAGSDEGTRSLIRQELSRHEITRMALLQSEVNTLITQLRETIPSPDVYLHADIHMGDYSRPHIYHPKYAEWREANREPARFGRSVGNLPSPRQIDSDSLTPETRAMLKDLRVKIEAMVSIAELIGAGFGVTFDTEYGDYASYYYPNNGGGGGWDRSDASC
jgi:hypothetical protein